MSKTKPMYVGVDDGHYSIKVSSDLGHTTFASRAQAGRVAGSIGFGDNVSAFYKTEGQEFTVNENVSAPLDTRFAEYPYSALNRVLVHHALRNSELGGKDVIITTGLPFDDFYGAKEGKAVHNKTLIAAKTASIMQPVMGAGDFATIIKNYVTTEAIAAYFDQIMDMNGDETPFYEEASGATVGVLDIGGKTTDCAIVLPGGSEVDMARSAGCNQGVLQLNEGVAFEIKKRFDLNYVEKSAIEAIIRTGKVRFDGESHDVSDIVHAQKQILVESIMNFLRPLIGSGRELGALLVVGGGSIVLRDELKPVLSKGAVYVNEPQFANSRGMYKVAKYIAGGEG